MSRKDKKRIPAAGASPRQERRPVAGATVGLKKRPVPGPGGVPHTDACLVFGLQLMDHDGRWAWPKMTSEEAKMIADKCKGFESMRPHEVFQASGNKPIPLNKICPEAQARLRTIELEDYELWELRLGGKPRMWGVRERNVFYIVWWDPDHTVCESKKRHT